MEYRRKLKFQYRITSNKRSLLFKRPSPRGGVYSEAVPQFTLIEEDDIDINVEDVNLVVD